MKKIAFVAASLALAAGTALAGPADIALGTGAGDYEFSGSNIGQADTSFFVTLDAGTYTFSSDVGSTGTKLLNVWLSLSDDGFLKPNTNDLVRFDKVPGSAKHEWDLNDYTLTLTQTTTIFLNVDAKDSRQLFDGSLHIVAAPVPEPASGALLLAGLGMLAFMGRRRRG